MQNAPGTHRTASDSDAARPHNALYLVLSASWSVPFRCTHCVYGFSMPYIRHIRLQHIRHTLVGAHSFSAYSLSACSLQHVRFEHIRFHCIRFHSMFAYSLPHIFSVYAQWSPSVSGVCSVAACCVQRVPKRCQSVRHSASPFRFTTLFYHSALPFRLTM